MLTGYAVVWDKQSVDLGGFIEVFRRGAFTRTLRESGDVFFLHAHRHNDLLGSREAGSLRLEEDGTGLRFELDPPDTTLGRDVAELVGKRILRGMSFGFTVTSADDEAWSQRPDGVILREVFKAELLEVSTTQWPAYPASAVTAERSTPAHVRRADMLRRLLDARVAA